jgi:hypothetical protein
VAAAWWYLLNEQCSELADTPDTLGCHDAEFSEVTADRIHQHGPLPDQQVTRAV